jgi:hypothetical protein
MRTSRMVAHALSEVFRLVTGYRSVAQIHAVVEMLEALRVRPYHAAVRAYGSCSGCRSTRKVAGTVVGQGPDPRRLVH